jgi:chromosomal replication initiation ATPase DnaA
MAEWFTTELRSTPLRQGETIVIDDGDVLLEEISRRNQSGIFMDLTEKLIQVDGTLVILGSAAPEKIACTKQIQSRLNSGLFFGIDAPVDSELAPLLDLIAKQRGIQLSEAKKGFILRRVSRTLPALVECIEKVEEPRELSAPITSFNALSEAVYQQPESAPPDGRKLV